jgi:hypothetical protein
MQESARKQRVAQTQFESFNETLRFSGGLAVDFLDALGDKTKKFADVFQAAMASVKRAAINALILGEGPLAGILGLKSTVGGSTGGLLGMLFGSAGAAGGGTVSGAEWLAAGQGLGPLAARADGGIIRGPGTGTSDSIVARVSHGEYVVRAAATAKHLPLLEAINAGTFPRFADGGLVGPAAIRAGSGGGAAPVHQTNHFNVKVEGSGGTPAQNQDLSDRMVRGMQDMAASMVAKGIRQQMRPGGMLRAR